MTTTNNTSTALITRSISRNEIVRIAHTDELAAELEALCDAYGESYRYGGDVEYWGTDADGDEWRVHLTH